MRASAARLATLGAAMIVLASAGSARAQDAEAPIEGDATLAAEADATSAIEDVEDVVAVEAEAPPIVRSLEQRYVDALAGTWAGSGILIGAVGTAGVLVGLGVGCSFDAQLGCGVGAIGGSIAGTSLGWIVGPAVGTSAGVGLDFFEGVAAWALGLGTHLTLFALGLAIGHAVDETQQTWGLGRVWGMISGVALGALAQMFLTPLYAVLLFPDRPRATRSEARSVELFLAPRSDGAWAGMHGTF